MPSQASTHTLCISLRIGEDNELFSLKPKLVTSESQTVHILAYYDQGYVYPTQNGDDQKLHEVMRS